MNEYTPNRRQCLLLAGTAVIASIAGCNSGSESSDTETPSPTENPGPTETPSPAETQSYERDFEEAVGHIQDAADRLERQSSSFDTIQSANTDFDAAPIKEDLDEAKVILEGIEGESDSEDIVRRAQAGLVIVAFGKDIADGLERGFNALSHFRTAAQYYGNTRFEFAASESAAAKEQFRTAVEKLDAAEAHISEFNSDYADEYSLEDFNAAEITAQISRLQNVFTTMIGVSEGYKTMGEGYVDFQDGAQAYQNGRYSSALDYFNNAHDHFTSAAETLRQAEKEASTGFRPQVIQLTCVADHSVTLIEHYQTAVRAARNGNDQRQSEAERAAQSTTEDMQQCSQQSGGGTQRSLSIAGVVVPPAV